MLETLLHVLRITAEWEQYPQRLCCLRQCDKYPSALIFHHKDNWWREIKYDFRDTPKAQRLVIVKQQELQVIHLTALFTMYANTNKIFLAISSHLSSLAGVFCSFSLASVWKAQMPSKESHFQEVAVTCIWGWRLLLEEISFKRQYAVFLILR